MEAMTPDFENFKWNDNTCTSVAFAICQKEYRFLQESKVPASAPHANTVSKKKKKPVSGNQY
jgi:hypothetical protein